MRNIWIDGFEANVKQRLGSGRLALELLKNIEKIDKKNNYTVLLASAPLPDLPKEREGFRYRILKVKKLKTFLGVPFEYFKEKQKPDVVFSPTHYIPRFIKSKRVGMIFDLSYLHFPELLPKKDLYKLKNWSKYTIKNSDKIITISQSSKKDILKNYQISKEKIEVCYPGFDSNEFKIIRDKEKIEKVKNKYGISKNYIIYIGTIQPRKNLVKLIEAFSRTENLELVIVGKFSGVGRQAWMSEEILSKPKELGIENRVIFTNFVENEEMVLLLNGAEAFILPSLWEGFGIPPVEAMACGVPVIVSNVSSLPEVVGKAGILVNPKSSDQIEHAIRLLTTDKKLRQKLIKLGLERAKKFTWKKMAREVIKVLESV